MKPKVGWFGGLLLALLLFLMLSNLGSGNSTQTSLPQGFSGTTPIASVVPTVANLTAPIVGSSEWWVVDVWGPPEATFAKFQLVGGVQQLIGKCLDIPLARPEIGEDKMHYRANEADPTLFVPLGTGFQTFRISEDVTSFLPTPTFTVSPPPPTTVAPTETSVPGVTPFAIQPETQPRNPRVTLSFATCLTMLLVAFAAIVLVAIILWLRGKFRRE